MNIVAAHIDAPRIDLKQNPIYEDLDLALFKTHYYGGIKKYQWTTIPLALHGFLVKGDGTNVNITLGEDDNDPIFCITDLLPHLAQNQMNKNMKDAISGEGLNILIGSMPNTSLQFWHLGHCRASQGRYFYRLCFVPAILNLIPNYQAYTDEKKLRRLMADVVLYFSGRLDRYMTLVWFC
jgi:hypothetical protein